MSLDPAVAGIAADAETFQDASQEHVAALKAHCGLPPGAKIQVTRKNVFKVMTDNLVLPRSSDNLMLDAVALLAGTNVLTIFPAGHKVTVKRDTVSLGEHSSYLFVNHTQNIAIGISFADISVDRSNILVNVSMSLVQKQTPWPHLAFR